jgi:hypothetical protein
MAALDLHHGRKPHELAADLRRAFSGIVAGNVKEDGMRRIEERGPFEIHGDADMMQALDALLRAFVEPAAHEDRRRIPAVLSRGDVTGAPRARRHDAPYLRQQ